MRSQIYTQLRNSELQFGNSDWRAELSYSYVLRLTFSSWQTAPWIYIFSINFNIAPISYDIEIYSDILGWFPDWRNSLQWRLILTTCFPHFLVDVIDQFNETR